MDEFVYGAREAAWPLIRTDLSLTYLQIGVLISLPAVASHLVEPALGILGDVWDRKRLILGGGIVLAVSFAFVAASPSFLFLLFSLFLMNPASGAFVSLSQASFMDTAPARHEQNMVRWTLAGSVGVVLGAIALGTSVALGGGWRGIFIASAAAAVAMVVVAGHVPLAGTSGSFERHGLWSDLLGGLATALRALRSGAVLRWLALLELSNLMLDGLHGYLALYFVDVVKTSASQAALGVAVWTGSALVGSLALVPLLERVRGLTYLRYSAAASLVVFILFLVAPSPWMKFAALAVLGFGNAGWYSVLQAQVYSAMRGKSGTVLAIQNVSGLAGSLIPLALGLAATTWGLGPTMLLLLAGPIALLIGLPSPNRSNPR